MGTVLKNNLYFYLLKQKQGFKPQEFFSGIYDKPRFNFPEAKATYKDIPEHIKAPAKGSCGRKMVAIPCSLFTGIILTTAYVAKAIFALAYKWNTREFKQNIFSAARTVQQGSGFIAMVFHERYGKYLIDKASFHLYCYEFITDKNHKIPFTKV